MIGKTTNAKVRSYEMYEFNRMKCTNCSEIGGYTDPKNRAT